MFFRQIRKFFLGTKIFSDVITRRKMAALNKVLKSNQSKQKLVIDPDLISQ